ncbi:VOC family protein [Subtercola lobariae]|uniref:Glyoxalase n=1 Tax=Subtercola lobariae TaxID=1588641 RepID=A0A917EU49_9MICO|nr:VOC family protein [Subtercola lobariae]GGF13853.1 glyoxalase [Subtercola lobariae]
MFARMHHLVIDTRDPAALAAFYSQMLGMPVTFASDDWVVVAQNETTSGLAFQRAPDHTAPTWPNDAVPQQMHIDFMVDDLDGATAAAVRLGARLSEHGDHVLYDPAGHPFCLISRPGWAPPISG